MSNNLLEVEFKYGNKDFAKVDADARRLHEIGRDFGEIGSNLKFGESTKKEFAKVDNAGQNSSNRIRKFNEEFSKPVTKSFAESYKSAFSDIESRAQKTLQGFQKLKETKLNKGQFDVITQGAIGAEQKVNDLTNQIKRLKKEAADPANAKLGKKLAEDLRIAEGDLNKYERKLTTLNRSQSSLSGGSGGRRRGLSEFQRSALEVADDFAPVGLNRPFNAVARELLLVNTLSATTLATFGAIAVAGYVIVDATRKIREEAERQLKYETAISAAGNRAIKANQKALRDFEFSRRLDESDRRFSQFLPDASVEELKKRRQNLEQLVRANPDAEGKSEVVTAFKSQIKAIDAALFKQYENRKTARDKEIASRQNFVDLQKQLNNQEIENNLQYAKAIANRDLKGTDLTKENLRLEIEALKKQIQNNKNSAADSLLNLTSGDFDSQKGFQIRRQTESENAKLQNQIAVLQITSQKQIADEIKASQEIVRDLNAKLNGDNQFVTYFAEAEAAVRRLKESVKDPTLLQDALKLQGAINFKQFSNLSFQSDLKAIDFEQDAFRVSRIRDNQFASFERALGLVEKKVDFALKINQLNRDISETDFYGRNYNPNNPKSFEETARRFAGDDPAIRNSLSDVGTLKRLDLGGTGIAGESAVAGEVLKVIPPLQELVNALNNPKLAGDARYLLGKRSDALRSVRENETQKLKDFIYDQETAGMNKNFAYDKLAILKARTGLSKGEYAQNYLDITKNLGNDIDPQLRRGIYEQSLEAGKYEREKKDRADKYLENISSKLDALYTQLGGVITEGGVKTSGTVRLDEDSKQALTSGGEVIIRDQRNGLTGSSGTQNDVSVNYEQSIREGFANSLGGYRGD